MFNVDCGFVRNPSVGSADQASRGSAGRLGAGKLASETENEACRVIFEKGRVWLDLGSDTSSRVRKWRFDQVLSFRWDELSRLRQAGAGIARQASAHCVS